MNALNQPAAAPLVHPSNAALKLAETACREFDLLQSGDRVAVAISGGKDSLLLASVCAALSRRHDFFGEVEFVGVHLDQKQPGFDRDGLDRAMARTGLPWVVVEQDTHSIVQQKLEPGQIPCSICSRLRRGILNQWCVENGFNRLALGHHLDDAVETFFLNLFFRRQLDPLKPATPATDGPTTIRPLILLEERKIAGWVADAGIVPVACPVCDTYPASQRRNIKAMLCDFERYHPDFRDSVRTALYAV